MPLDVARRAARLLALAREIGAIGNKNARSDALVAEGLARAALAGAVENVRVNVASLSDGTPGRRLLEEAERLGRHSEGQDDLGPSSR
jgi:formiminotetrahydrofolate cyclodeaminase